MIVSILIFLLSGACNLHSDDRSARVVNMENKTDSIPNNILIISSFDPTSLNVRKNKRELFRELTDSVKFYLSKKIKEQTGKETIVIPEIASTNEDSLVFSLMEKNSAVRAILIRSLEAYFEERSEKETTDSDGKPQVTTAYDLCAKNEYTLYAKNERLKESKIDNCEYFTSRSVRDRHFVIKFGPDIVGKKKHTYGIVEKNAQRYLSEIMSEL